MLLAELDIRHTRRHLPTRRVALAHARLPMSPTPYGAVLVGAVVSDNVGELDDELRDDLDRLIAAARSGHIRVPSGALRHRVQHDLHGLARSRHRLVGDDGLLVAELAVHGSNPAAQVIGALLGVARMAPHPRLVALRSVERALQRPGSFPDDLVVRHLTQIEHTDPLGLGLAGAHELPDGWFVDPDLEEQWRGFGAEERWAMETLGFSPDVLPVATEVQRRFRRLVTFAHPDHGGTADDAASRIQELGEARRMLLEQLQADDDPERAAG
jgi:hypothetical protein